MTQNIILSVTFLIIMGTQMNVLLIIKAQSKCAFPCSLIAKDISFFFYLIAHHSAVKFIKNSHEPIQLLLELNIYIYIRTWKLLGHHSFYPHRFPHISLSSLGNNSEKPWVSELKNKFKHEHALLGKRVLSHTKKTQN